MHDHVYVSLKIHHCGFMSCLHNACAKSPKLPNKILSKLVPVLDTEYYFSIDFLKNKNKQTTENTFDK